MDKSFDLLSTIEYGGCSAKLPAGFLSEVLKELPVSLDPNLLVDVNTHDDAGVYRINGETALIFTTDFFLLLRLLLPAEVFRLFFLTPFNCFRPAIDFLLHSRLSCSFDSSTTFLIYIVS